MSSSDSATAHSPRAFGPIQILSTSLSRQLLGFVLAFIGIQLIGWATDGNTGLSSAVIYTAIGTFVVFNGLYLGGVRFR